MLPAAVNIFCLSVKNLPIHNLNLADGDSHTFPQLSETWDARSIISQISAEATHAIRCIYALLLVSVYKMLNIIKTVLISKVTNI